VGTSHTWSSPSKSAEVGTSHTWSSPSKSQVLTIKSRVKSQVAVQLNQASQVKGSP